MTPDFVPTKLEEERSEIKDTFTVRLNAREREWLDADKKIMEQPKDSTAIKQLAWLGHVVLHDSLTGDILGIVFKNKRKNKRMGIVDFED